MSETEERQNVQVNDRRRFDPEGNPREASETPTSEPESAPKGKEVFETAEAAPPSPLEAENSRLKQELEASRKRVDDLARAFQALSQDREEFKQRLTRERERMIDVEKGNVALSLLEAIDELDLCMGATAEGDSSPLAKGVRLIRENLIAKLNETGIERLKLVGEPFDPNLAEAADMEVTVDPQQDQKVVAETRAGYRLKGRLIRPARVKVAKFVQPASA
jgi:molecular chaperone GrpE